MTACIEGSIPVVHHERRAGENGANYFPLHPDAAAVNNPQGIEAEPVGFGEIFFNHGFYVAGRNAVQIEDVGYRDSDGDFGIGHIKENPTGPKREPAGSSTLQRA
jgi:hypothetical protein